LTSAMPRYRPSSGRRQPRRERFSKQIRARSDAKNLRGVRHRSPKAAKIVGFFVGLSQNRAEIHEQNQLAAPIVRGALGDRNQDFAGLAPPERFLTLEGDRLRLPAELDAFRVQQK
jgi:hypothetical protein